MAQDVASSSGNAPREAVTETPDIDGERKSVLFLSYNPKIRENDFMNIDAFLREECQMRWAPRSPQPAELAESIARCVSKGVRFSADKTCLHIPVLVFKEDGIQHAESDVDVRIAGEKKCVIGPSAEHKLTVLQLMTERDPELFRDTGYEVFLGRLKRSPVSVLIPTANPRAMEIAGMFQLEHVNSTKFGMHEVLLPVDFVKKWKTTDGFINKNPLVMNKVIFIVLFMGMLQGHHDADKTSTVTELKRRLFEVAKRPRPGRQRQNARNRQRTALHTFDDEEENQVQQSIEFDLEAEYGVANEQETIDQTAWRAVVRYVFGQKATHTIPIPKPCKRWKHATRSSPVRLGMGKSPSSTGGKCVAGGSATRGKVDMYSTKQVETLLRDMYTDDQSPVLIKCVSAACVLALSSMCTKDVFGPIICSILASMKTDQTTALCVGVLLHVHPVIGGMETKQKSGLMTMLARALSTADIEMDTDDEQERHRLVLFHPLVRMCTEALDDPETPLSDCVQALAFVTVQMCTSVDFIDVCSKVSSIQDIMDAVDDTTTTKLYTGVCYTTLQHVDEWEHDTDHQYRASAALQCQDRHSVYTTLLYLLTTTKTFDQAVSMNMVKEMLDQVIDQADTKVQEVYRTLAKPLMVPMDVENNENIDVNVL